MIGKIEALSEAHTWLAPPRTALEQQSPLPALSAEQRRHAQPESGFRRIRGVAGAGKSLVLTQRAAAANHQGRKVLVLSFNITMSHVLHDLLKRAPNGLDWSRVTWNHFHAWAKIQAVNAGLDVGGGETGDESSEAYDRRLLAMLEQIALGNALARNFEKPVYGGIYVDEAQDFDASWLDALASFLEPGGELVIVADHRQNLYGKDGGRDRNLSMKRCRFSGPWAQLPQKSYRLPWRIALTLNEFAQAVTLGDGEDLPLQQYAKRPAQEALAIDVLTWLPVVSTEAALDSIDSALGVLGNPHVNDVCVLLPSHALGFQAVDQLLPRNHKIVHVFGSNASESRQRKVAFWMGRGGLKMCTIHSFKGWEIDNVILIWPPDERLNQVSQPRRCSLFYTALSRGLRNLVVLNANRAYDRFFADWDLMTTQSDPTPIE